MARVTFSPLVVEMSGKVGDAVFARWKGIDYVRSRITPSNPRSTDQVAIRDALSNSLTMWQSVKSWAQGVWNYYATGYALSGYNRYMAMNILHTRDAEIGHLTPNNPDYLKISGQAIAAGGAGEVDVTWTNAGGVPGTDWVTTHYRKSETDSEVYAWTWNADTDPSLETVTITGLDTGEEYEVAVHAATGLAAQAQEAFHLMLNAG